MSTQRNDASELLADNSTSRPNVEDKDESGSNKPIEQDATSNRTSPNSTIVPPASEEHDDGKQSRDDCMQHLNVETSHVLKHVAQEIESGRRNDRWFYPSLWFVTAMNLFLACSMVYATIKILDYTRHRSEYRTITWLIWGIPMIIATWFILSPIPQKMSRSRIEFSEKKWFKENSPFLVKLFNVLNALVCFVLVVTYLWVSAIPKYNRPRWVEDLNFTFNLPIPSFAFIFVTNSDATISPFSYTQTQRPSISASIGDGTDVVNFPSGSLYVDQDASGNIYVVANSSFALNEAFDNPAATMISFSVNGTYNSSAATDFNPGTSNVFIAAFDPRVKPSDIYDCGIVSTQNVSPFMSSFFSVSVSQVTDPLNAISPPADYSTSCTETFHNLFGNANAPLVMYDVALTGILPTLNGSYTQECDTIANANATCTTYVTLNYAGQIVSERKTEPGIEKLDIWLDVGAIVGAVQFLCWFLVQLVGG